MEQAVTAVALKALLYKQAVAARIRHYWQQAPAQSCNFAAACSALQLASDGDGGTLQLQKRCK